MSYAETTTNGNVTVTDNYDDYGQFVSAGIVTSGPSGSTLTEDYDSRWQLLSAAQVVATDDGQNRVQTTTDYGPNWTVTGANVHSVSDTNPDQAVSETYDANWHMVSASVSDGYQSGQTNTVTTNNYDGNWTFTGHDVSLIFSPSANAVLETINDYDATGAFHQGAAAWSIGGVTGSDSWTTGTHQVTLTETANPGSATPLDKVVDVAYDGAGAMTGAKIFTYGIQGQAFTQTEEDYDASWHLTSWHGQGAAYDATVNYAV